MSSAKRTGRGSFIRQAMLAVTAGALASAAAATDIGDIVAVPTSDQSADQIRRDRYECHNWVVAQTGSVPPAGPSADEERRERRASRVGKVVTGAAVGAAVGSVIRGTRDHRDAGDGAIAGGVLGAIAGAAIGSREDEDERDEAFDEYYRALDACMTARGYQLYIANSED